VTKCMGWRVRECEDCIHLARSVEDEDSVKIARGDAIGFRGNPRPKTCPEYKQDAGRSES
jgi:hypothetical protein